MGEFSGTATQSQIDVDGDGDTATAASTAWQGNSSLGEIASWAVSDFLPWDGVSFCGPTAVTVVYSVASAVIRFESGDLLYLELSGGSACYDYTNYSFTFAQDSRITGGTGAFTGATGQITTAGTGQTLLRDSRNQGVLTAVRGTIRGDFQRHLR